MQQRYGYMVSEAYEAYSKDFENFRKKYNSVKSFDNSLLEKFNKAIDEINSKYAKALQELKNQRDQKQELLNKNYQELIQEIEKNENTYKDKYNAYIEELNNKKNAKLTEITSHENQEKAKVTEQHESAINTIIKAARLPSEGRVRFIPPDYYKNPNVPLPKGKSGGYLDNFKNEWARGPSRTMGE